MAGAVDRQEERERRYEAQRFEALGRLAAAVAHDFNNLLLVIGGLAWLLVDSLPAGTRDAERAAEIGRTSERAARLATQLLEFGKCRDDEHVEVGAALADLRGLLERLLGPRIAIELVRPGEPAHVALDAGRLGQVVVNLAVNARDAMPDGGRLTLQAAVEPGAVVVSVADSGTGIPDEVLPRIFEPLFTTKPHGRGSGLGLATVREIVVEHGGRIAVSTRPGVGTRFDVFLPRVV
jgi:signal transduction histidine kinase